MFLSLICFFIQERIRIGKELLEAKRIEEDNERKRSDSLSCITLCFILNAPNYKTFLLPFADCWL